MQLCRLFVQESRVVDFANAKNKAVSFLTELCALKRSVCSDCYEFREPAMLFSHRSARKRMFVTPTRKDVRFASKPKKIAEIRIFFLKIFLYNYTIFLNVIYLIWNMFFSYNHWRVCFFCAGIYYWKIFIENIIYGTQNYHPKWVV